MHPNKIKVGQRVRAVEMGKGLGPVPDCEGVIAWVGGTKTAFVVYDDASGALYLNPAEELISVGNKEQCQCEILMAEVERLRKEYDDLQNHAVEVITELGEYHKKEIHKIIVDYTLKIAHIRIENAFGGLK